MGASESENKVSPPADTGKVTKMSASGTKGHPDTLNRCPLLGVKRTLRQLVAMSAFDPKRTLAIQFSCDAQHLRFDVLGCRSRALGKAHEAAEIHRNNCGIGRCVAAFGICAASWQYAACRLSQQPGRKRSRGTQRGDSFQASAAAVGLDGGPKLPDRVSLGRG